jgi:hypothetical protein
VAGEGSGRFARFLSDVLILSAFCLVAISVVEPFFATDLILSSWWESQVITKVSLSYWSYKAVINPGHQQVFFIDFWFSHFPIPMFQPQISVAFIELFLAQVLTLAAGLLSLAVKRIGIRIVPFLSSITVTVLMNHAYSATVTHFSSIYQLGYWLMYPSIFLFLCAFGLSLAAKKRQTAHLQEDSSHS